MSRIGVVRSAIARERAALCRGQEGGAGGFLSRVCEGPRKRAVGRRRGLAFIIRIGLEVTMIIVSRDGYAVEVREDSHVRDHGVLALFTEAVASMALGGRSTVNEAVEMGRVVGTRACVVTPPGADVYFARRGERFGYTRMVRGIAPEPCSTLVVVLERDGEIYRAVTAYVGTPSPREPWDASLSGDAEALAQSVAFWSGHALVDDGSTPLELA
ncbi:MAG: hypothetical protein EB084_18085 [Proteobacteria bacterium]|nr:hypothetical protein [Pseudomonadota bacterium]